MKAATSSIGKQIIKVQWSACSLVSMDHQPVEQGSSAEVLGFKICRAMVVEEKQHSVFGDNVKIFMISEICKSSQGDESTSY